MKLWAVTMVRDEVDVLPYTIAHLLHEGVDGIIVADNRSVDGTREWLASIDDPRVVVVDDPEVAYYQSRKMSGLYQQAIERGADWVIPFDADEVWYDPNGLRLRDFFAPLPTGPFSVGAGAINYHPSATDDPGELNPFRRIRFRERAPQWKKVAVCAGVPGLVIEQGNHEARLPDGNVVTALAEHLEIGHFPWRSFEQFASKVRNGAEAYKLATLVPADQGLHWRFLGRVLDTTGLEGLYIEWGKLADSPGLVEAPVPWCAS